VRAEGANAPINVTVTFRSTLESKASQRFKVTYVLPQGGHVSRVGWDAFTLSAAPFLNEGWIVRKLTVRICLPEGARFLSSNVEPFTVQRGILQDSVTYVLYNVAELNNPGILVTYHYSTLWASLRPTTWMGILVAIGYVVAAYWRAPKPPTPAALIPIPPEDVKRFIDAYEEKLKTLSTLRILEEQARKRKIPRRRYKVRKKTLEGRLSTLNREITELREKMLKAGGRYAEIMRRIEVAETVLEGVEADIRRVRARYQRGEVSAGAYRRLLAEYERRRERARLEIDGALLRLREEIS